MTVPLTINRNHPRRNLFSRAFRGTGRLPGLIAALSLCLGPMAFGELVLPEIPRKKKKEDKTAVPLPPQAVPAEVEIHPGDEVRIPLKVYGWRGRNVKYLLRSRPKGGEVRLIPGDQGSWTLVYRHGGAIPPAEGTVDRFFFAAQDATGTSAPAEIRVKIVDLPPQFEMADRLDFGNTWTGVPQQREVMIANRGGGVIAGTLFADAPWRVEPEQFVLQRGEEKAVTIFFEPNSEQAYQGRLAVSSAERSFLALTGMARDAFRVEPTSLDLLPQTGGLQRKGRYTIENRTAAPQTLQLTGDARLKLPSELQLAPGEKVELPLQLGENDLQEFKGAILFSNGTIERQAQATAYAIGARIEAEGLDFGKLTAFEPVERTLTVSNRGGTIASVVLTAIPGVTLEPQRFDLDAGAKQEVKVTYHPQAEGEVTAALRLQTGESVVDIPLKATIALEALVTTRNLQLQPEDEEVVSTQPAKRSDGWSPVPQRSGDPSVPTVTKVAVRVLGSGKFELSWPSHEGRKDLRYRLEGQRLFHDIDGRLQVHWQPLDGVTIEQQGDRLHTVVTGIAKGRMLPVQIVTVTPDGKASYPSDTYQLGTLHARPFITLRRLILTGFLVMAGVAGWYRFRGSFRGFTPNGGASSEPQIEERQASLH